MDAKMQADMVARARKVLDARAIASAREAAEKDSQTPGGAIWKGETPGETLVGELTKVEEVENNFKEGEMQTRLIVEHDNGTAIIYANYSLARAIERVKPAVGQTIMILYVGPEKLKNGMGKKYGLSIIG